MLWQNEVFELDGRRLRLLESDPASDQAWCIAVREELAWPEMVPWSDIQSLESIAQEEPQHIHVSANRQKRRDNALKRIKPMLETMGWNIFEPSLRNRAIKDCAKEHNCSERTIHKDLRRFWQRGQGDNALLPDNHRSGRFTEVADGTPNEQKITAGRGRRPKLGHSVYQMTQADAVKMRDIIDSEFLTEREMSVHDAHVLLGKRHYRYEDGEGRRFVNPDGQLPSEKQFRHFLISNYDIEVRTRKRKGDSDFELGHRAVLGSFLQDCLGVGHIYEIDATIVDLYVVSKHDVRRIIGKPTLYLIIDRKSRLIVGFYWGLEHASWNAAFQAIASICEDKAALCARYGVAYSPSDWPAHRVIAKEFVADRGDMIARASTNIVDGVNATVTNTPTKRADWKGLVECGFKLMHCKLKAIVPAYDPPSNAERRRGKHFEKDACLNMDEFGKIILEAIITHNRSEILKYPLSIAEMNAQVNPDPISLWNDGITTRSGLLTRYEERVVRFKLLRRETATVTGNGVVFRGLRYASPELRELKWFERARVRTFDVTVSWDPRLTDQVYVHRLDGKGDPYVVDLTSDDVQYKGLSFEEARFHLDSRDTIEKRSKRQRYEAEVAYQDRIDPTIAVAKKRLEEDGGGASRSARRDDAKPQRISERGEERREKAMLPDFRQSPRGDSVNSLPLVPTVPAVVTPAPGSMKARLAAVQARRAASIGPNQSSSL